MYGHSHEKLFSLIPGVIWNEVICWHERIETATFCLSHPASGLTFGWDVWCTSISHFLLTILFLFSCMDNSKHSARATLVKEKTQNVSFLARAGIMSSCYTEKLEATPKLCMPAGCGLLYFGRSSQTQKNPNKTTSGTPKRATKRGNIFGRYLTTKEKSLKRCDVPCGKKSAAAAISSSGLWEWIWFGNIYF